MGGKTETVRTVTLTCLICDTLVYRVSQVISPDVESGEGLVLPTDDWVEKEVLRSADGWIEVSKDILVCAFFNLFIIADLRGGGQLRKEVFLPHVVEPPAWLFACIFHANANRDT